MPAYNTHTQPLSQPPKMPPHTHTGQQGALTLKDTHPSLNQHAYSHTLNQLCAMCLNTLTHTLSLPETHTCTHPQTKMLAHPRLQAHPRAATSPLDRAVCRGPAFFCPIEFHLFPKSALASVGATCLQPELGTHPSMTFPFWPRFCGSCSHPTALVPHAVVVKNHMVRGSHLLWVMGTDILNGTLAERQI